MSKHLPVLISMYPGKMMLGVDELASLLEYSKGHIYNLASSKKLPFKVATDIGVVLASPSPAQAAAMLDKGFTVIDMSVPAKWDAQFHQYPEIFGGAI